MEAKQIFKEGEKVVCVNSNAAQGQDSGLIEGKTYTITGAFFCNCGEGGITVGVPETIFSHLRCKCGKRYKYGAERVYSQYRFVPLDTNSQLEEAIFESLKGAKILN